MILLKVSDKALFDTIQFIIDHSSYHDVLTVEYNPVFKSFDLWFQVRNGEKVDSIDHLEIQMGAFKTHRRPSKFIKFVKERIDKLVGEE